MNIIQRITLYPFFLMLVLLIAICGCHTANNTIMPESSQVATKHRVSQTSLAEKETTTTEKPTNKVTGKPEEIEKISSVEMQKNLLAKWSNMMGHGGVSQSSSAAEETTTTGKSAEAEKESFIELEGNVIGKWMNLKETESLEFLDDGTIVIIDKRGVNPPLKGNYKFVDKDRLKVYQYGKGLYSKLLPPMSFKISISENEITLTDEPDGAATTYKRIK
jgi:hypothetical protein